MTAREQLAQAAENYREADKLALHGSPDNAARTFNELRKHRYREWIEACVRFRREG
jgi:hypothetical protein